jgi:hypothetical protein
VSGELKARVIIAAADEFAAWDGPDGFGDAFATLAQLPDVLGAVAEAVGSVAATIEEARLVHPEITSAAEEAANWAGRVAGDLGSIYSRYKFLHNHGNTTHWLPPAR